MGMSLDEMIENAYRTPLPEAPEPAPAARPRPSASTPKPTAPPAPTPAETPEQRRARLLAELRGLENANRLPDGPEKTAKLARREQVHLALKDLGIADPYAAARGSSGTAKPTEYPPDLSSIPGMEIAGIGLDIANRSRYNPPKLPKGTFPKQEAPRFSDPEAYAVRMDAIARMPPGPAKEQAYRDLRAGAPPLPQNTTPAADTLKSLDTKLRTGKTEEALREETFRRATDTNYANGAEAQGLRAEYAAVAGRRQKQKAGSPEYWAMTERLVRIADHLAARGLTPLLDVIPEGEAGRFSGKSLYPEAFGARRVPIRKDEEARVRGAQAEVSALKAELGMAATSGAASGVTLGLYTPEQVFDFGPIKDDAAQKVQVLTSVLASVLAMQGGVGAVGRLAAGARAEMAAGKALTALTRTQRAALAYEAMTPAMRGAIDMGAFGAIGQAGAQVRGVPAEVPGADGRTVVARVKPPANAEEAVRMAAIGAVSGHLNTMAAARLGQIENPLLARGAGAIVGAGIGAGTDLVLTGHPSETMGIFGLMGGLGLGANAGGASAAARVARAENLRQAQQASGNLQKTVAQEWARNQESRRQGLALTPSARSLPAPYQPPMPPPDLITPPMSVAPPDYSGLARGGEPRWAVTPEGDVRPVGGFPLVPYRETAPPLRPPEQVVITAPGSKYRGQQVVVADRLPDGSVIVRMPSGKTQTYGPGKTEPVATPAAPVAEPAPADVPPTMPMPEQTPAGGAMLPAVGLLEPRVVSSLERMGVPPTMPVERPPAVGGAMPPEPAPQRAPVPAPAPVEPTPAPATGRPRAAIEADLNRVRNSLREGEMRLRSGLNSDGKKMSAAMRAAVERSVANERAKVAALEAELGTSAPAKAPTPAPTPAEPPAATSAAAAPTDPRTAPIPAVFARMPEAVLETQAKGGVVFAQRELARRRAEAAGTEVVPPAPAEEPKTSPTAARESAPPAPEQKPAAPAATVPGSEVGADGRKRIYGEVVDDGQYAAREKVQRRIEALPFALSLEDLSYRDAVDAFRGVSFSPERRGRDRQLDYAEHIADVYERFRERAEKQGKQAELIAAMERYRDGYLQRYRALLAAKSRVMSTMITGPSNFPVARNAKRVATEGRRLQEIVEYSQRGQDAIRKMLIPESQRPVSSDNADAPTLLEEKIAKAERLQELMRSANTIVRKKALTPEQKVEQLVALGMKEGLARKVLEPDYMGRAGFPDYELTNNAANIRRMKGRVQELETKRAQTSQTWEFDGVRVEDSVEDNRLRLYFADRQGPDVVKRLKEHGFKWAPSVGAWQRMRSNQARYWAGEIIGQRLTDAAEPAKAAAEPVPEEYVPVPPIPEETEPTPKPAAAPERPAAPDARAGQRPAEAPEPKRTTPTGRAKKGAVVMSRREYLEERDAGPKGQNKEQSAKLTREYYKKVERGEIIEPPLPPTLDTSVPYRTPSPRRVVSDTETLKSGDRVYFRLRDGETGIARKVWYTDSTGERKFRLVDEDTTKGNRIIPPSAEGEPVEAAPGVRTIEASRAEAKTVSDGAQKKNNIGLTPAQSDWVLDKLKVAEEHLKETEQPVQLLVPDDGTFVVTTEAQARTLAKTIEKNELVGGGTKAPMGKTPSDKKRLAKAIESGLVEVSALTAAEQAEMAAAKATIAKARKGGRLRGAAGQLPEGEGASDIVAAYLTVAKLTVRAGARTFAEFAKRMVDELGDTVNPYLRGLWKRVNPETNPEVLREEARQTPQEAAGGPETARTPASATARPAGRQRASRGQSAGASGQGSPRATRPRATTTTAQQEGQPFMQEGRRITPSVPASGESLGKYTGAINLERVNAPEDLQRVVVERVVENAQRVADQRRGTMSFTEMEAAAREMGLTVEQLTKLKPGTTGNAEFVTAARDLHRSLLDDLVTASDAYRQTPTDEHYLRFMEAQQRYDAVMMSLQGLSTEAGRALAAHRILADATRAKRQAIDLTTGKPVTQEGPGADAARADVTRWQEARRQAMQEMAKDFGRDASWKGDFLARMNEIPPGDYTRLAELLRSSRKPRQHWIHNYVVGNLLSGLQGAAVDLTSTALWGSFQRLLVQPLANALQYRDLRMAVPRFTGWYTGLRAGARAAGETLRRGYTMEDAERQQLYPELPGGGKNPWNWFPRFRSALNTLHLYPAYEMGKWDYARHVAHTEGRRGQDFLARVRDLVANPTLDMVEFARDYGEYMTFSQHTSRMDPVIGKNIERARNVNIPGTGVYPGKLAIVFSKTLYWIVRRGLEMTPAGLFRLALPETYRPRTEIEMQERYRTLALGLTGLAMVGAAIPLAASGNLTAVLPKSPRDRERLYGTGARPWSVRIGGAWYAYNKLGPFALPLAFASGWNTQVEEVQTAQVMRAFAMLGAAGFDQSMLRTLSDVDRAFNDPNVAPRTVENLAAVYIPFVSFWRNMRRLSDPVMRDPQAYTMREPFLTQVGKVTTERFMNQMPLLSTRVPAKVDALGGTVEDDLGFLNGLSPIYVRRVIDNGLANELARLRWWPTKTTPTFRRDQQVTRVTGAQKEALLRESGGAVRDAIVQTLQTRAYWEADDEHRIRLLEKSVDKARGDARDAFYEATTGILSTRGGGSGDRSSGRPRRARRSRR